jgi:hypothetical protein
VGLQDGESPTLGGVLEVSQIGRYQDRAAVENTVDDEIGVMLQTVYLGQNEH